MKKFVSVLLCVVLAFCAVSITAFAADGAEAKIGDTEYATLAEAVAAANADADVTTIELLADAAVDATLAINEALIINGNNNTITTNAETTFKVYADFTVNNVEIINNAAYGRCIDTRVGDIEVNINNSVLKTTATYTQPLNISGTTDEWGEAEAITVNVIGSTVAAEEHGYAIITFVPVNLAVKDSAVTGYAALYMKGAIGTKGSAGSAVFVEGSTLHSVNKYPSTESDSFGTVVLADDEIGIFVDGTSTISCESTNNSTQYLIVLHNNDVSGDPVNFDYVIIDNGAKLTTITENNGAAKIIAGTAMKYDDNVNISNAVSIPAEYIEQVYDNGNGYITAIEPETGLAIVLAEKSDFETMLGHSHSADKLTKVETKAATCTEDGVAEHYICDDEMCEGAFYADANGSVVLFDTTISATGHNIVKVEAVAATADKEGNIAHYKCENCGKLYSDAQGTKELAAKDVVIAKLTGGDKGNTDKGNVDTGTKSPATGDSAIAVAVFAISAAALGFSTRKVRD